MLRFGVCELDVAKRELRRDAVVTALEPQAFDLLVYLVEHRDRVVPKHELLDRVWGHTYLSESNLTTRVKEVRRAVGDDGTRQHTISNIRGHGYRFVADLVVDVNRDLAAPGRFDLVGRDADLAAVIRLVDRAPLVTFTGPGGVGKSTLARRIALEAAPRRSDGTHRVQLAPLDAPGDVLVAIVRALDLVLDTSRAEDTVRVIARLDALLVLDNCEHVVDEVAQLVEQLLGVAGSRLGILATSRVRLGVSAEAVMNVVPLDVEAARELFTRRVQAIVPAWDAVDVGEDRVDRIVAGLDRLPLAIEMAAARLGSITIDELEEAVDTGDALRQMSHRSPASRHRSVGSLVDWSVSMLEPAHRRLFAEFSVFAGGVTAADAAEVLVADDPWSTRFALSALAERSLLVADLDGAEARYSMLATVRVVAEHQLDGTGETATVRLRHAEHLRDALVEIDDQARTPDEGLARVRLDGLVDEVRAAHRWAREYVPALAADLSASLFHVAHSALWSEPAEWSRLLLERPGSVGGPPLHGAVVASAGAAAHRGDLALAKAQATSVAEGATGRLRASALELLADVSMYEGDLAETARLAEELGRLGDELDDAHVATFAVVDRSLGRTYAGDPDAGVRALTAHPSELAPSDAAWLAYARGEALSAAGDAAAAVSYREAIELGSVAGGQFVVSVALTSLAVEHARAGDISAALDGYADALSTFLRRGNHTHAVTAIRNLVGLLVGVGDDEGAARLAGSLEAIRPSYGSEAERMAESLAEVRRRVGEARFGAWSNDGRALDVDDALRAAVEIVDRRRG